MSVQVKGSGTIGGLDEGLVVSGIVTSSTQVNVGSNIKLGNAGVITATSFVGNGANFNGAANFSYDGTRCLIGTNTAAPYVNRNLTVAQGSSGNTTVAIEVRSPTNGDGRLIFTDSTSANSGAYKGQIRYDQTNDFMSFNTNGDNERLRINSSGNLGLGESSSIDARLHVNSGTDNATLFLESTDGDVNLCMADNAGSCRLLQAGGNLRFRTGGNANAFGTGDSEKMVLDGNGRLLIGTTTEGLATYGENLTIGSVGNGGMTIRTGTGNKGTVYFSDGTSGTAEYKGSIQYDHSDDSLRLAAGGSVRLRVESTGEVRMLPSTSGNTNTQFSFNNVASTPFISIKSNNVSEAVELRFEEDNGGANICLLYTSDAADE